MSRVLAEYSVKIRGALVWISKNYLPEHPLAALMIATRRVDWYALGGGAAAPRAAVPDAAGA